MTKKKQTDLAQSLQRFGDGEDADGLCGCSPGLTVPLPIEELFGGVYDRQPFLALGSLQHAPVG